SSRFSVNSLINSSRVLTSTAIISVTRSLDYVNLCYSFRFKVHTRQSLQNLKCGGPRRDCRLDLGVIHNSLPGLALLREFVAITLTSGESGVKLLRSDSKSPLVNVRL